MAEETEEEFGERFKGEIKKTEDAQRYQFRKGTKWAPWSWRNESPSKEEIENTMGHVCSFLPDENSVESVLKAEEGDPELSSQECKESIPWWLERLNFNKGEGSPCDYGLLTQKTISFGQYLGKLTADVPLEKSVVQGRAIKDLRHMVGELLAEHIIDNCGCREEKDTEYRKTAAKSLRDLKK